MTGQQRAEPVSQDGFQQTQGEDSDQGGRRAAAEGQLGTSAFPHRPVGHLQQREQEVVLSYQLDTPQGLQTTRGYRQS